MKFNSIILFSIILLFFSSCKKEKILIAEIVEGTAQEIDEETKFRAKNTPIILSFHSKQIVEDWQEYQNIVEFIPKYYKTTTKEALFNSQQLVKLTQQLKDSIRVENFDEPSFRVRLNLLNNEALRLADMDSIPSITDKEIIQETKNIVNAFNAINAKINTVVNKNILETDLKEFDELFTNKDSTKISVEIKPITKYNSSKIRSKRIDKKEILRKRSAKKMFNKSIKPISELKKSIKPLPNKKHEKN